MNPPERNTVLVNATTPAARFEVTCDMDGLTGRAGTALLTGLTDAIGLSDGLVCALRRHSRAVRHEPRRIVRDLAVMLADGGDCLTDLGALRDQGVLFGDVASDATAYRCAERLDEGMLERIREARGAARRRVWNLSNAPSRAILDIDATLVTSHSEKEGAVGTYKGGFGFHPLLAFEAATGEALAGILRPGNAGANTASDHIEVLDRALAQLPEGAAGPDTLVRCDSAGATRAFLDAVAARGLSFPVGCDLKGRVRDAILDLPESAWMPALDSEGSPRGGAWVAELGLDLSACLKARARSAAVSARIPGRSSRFPTWTVTASRSCSPTRPGRASRGWSRCTALARRSRTRSGAPRRPGFATCRSAPFR